jgi:DHA2 family multidrug resistance protein
MIMVTISLIATAYHQPQDAGSASSLFNILRNLGGAIGIALLATLLDARQDLFRLFARAVVPRTRRWRAPGAPHRTPWQRQAALGKLSEIAHQQASIMAYNDAFHAVGIAWPSACWRCC